MEQQQQKALLACARKARENAYAPYSNFCVGAALLAESGTCYTGCNVENAAFGPTNCAERTAFFKAVSEGERAFRMIAIVGGKRGETAFSPCWPCGVCRQVMAEFCGPDFLILTEDEKGGIHAATLAELLPNSFGAQTLMGEESI